jgi:hypothetical protein
MMNLLRTCVATTAAAAISSGVVGRTHELLLALPERVNVIEPDSGVASDAIPIVKAL